MQIKVNTRQIESLIPKIERFRASVVPIASGVLTKQIVTLSQSGRDFMGNAFPKLIPAYKRYKVKKGHPGVPNLTFTGKYLNRIGLRQDGAKIPWVGPVDSFMPQAEGLSKKRKHLGVHPDTPRNTESALQNAWKGMLA